MLGNGDGHVGVVERCSDSGRIAGWDGEHGVGTVLGVYQRGVFVGGGGQIGDWGQGLVFHFH